MQSVSVVIATRDRRALLERAIAALTAQTVTPLEIVVVDDASTDTTPDLASDQRVKYVRGEGQGPGIARNLGWRQATGDLVAFTDDDCEPTPEWLAALLRAYRPGTVVQGRTVPNPAETDRTGPFMRSLRVEGPSPHFETANILYQRSALQQLGGFDPAYAIAGEDTDLGQRAVLEGLTHVYEPAALVYHAVHIKTAKQTLKDATRASDAVLPYKKYPHLRRYLQDDVYFDPSHPLLAKALLGAVLARKQPAAAAMIAPYAVHLARRCRDTGSGPGAVPFFVLKDAVQIAAAVHGAVKHRTPMF